MKRPIWHIADEIALNWNKPNFAAKPYLQAMFWLSSINDRYGADDARGIVLYFLANAQSWRGPVARRIKAELKELCK